MPNEINWEAADSYTGSSCIVDEEPAHDAGVVGAEIDNSTALNRWMALYFDITWASGTLDGPVEVFVIYAVDGTNYDSGSTSLKPFHRNKVADLEIEETGSNRHYTLLDIPIRPFKFKVVLWNSTGETFATNGLNCDAYTYNEEVQ